MSRIPRLDREERGRKKDPGRSTSQFKRNTRGAEKIAHCVSLNQTEGEGKQPGGTAIVNGPARSPAQEKVELKERTAQSK